MTIKTRSKTPETASKAPATRARKAEPAKVAQAKQADIIDAVAEQPVAAAVAPQPLGVELPGLDQNVTGRGVFAVRTLGNAVSVESAFLAEDGNVLRLPAVFPNREYALEQLEELWKLVNQHFDELSRNSGN